jgi:hypothetical protein|tara:strand:+ start:3422 stop:3772 length:351 start_codon:yes stop_codon:yes gene_type:complete
MKKILLLLMFFSAPVMPDPVELTCEDNNETEKTLTIDLEEGSVSFNTLEIYKGLQRPIYFINDHIIVWIRLPLTDHPMISTYLFNRKNGRLIWSVIDEEHPDGGVKFQYQCFMPIL